MPENPTPVAPVINKNELAVADVLDPPVELLTVTKSVWGIDANCGFAAIFYISFF